MDEIRTFKNIEKLLTALLFLLIEQRDQNPILTKVVKTEVILSNLGFTGPEIAKLTNKNPGAVRKAIQRSKSK